MVLLTVSLGKTSQMGRFGLREAESVFIINAGRMISIKSGHADNKVYA